MKDGKGEINRIIIYINEKFGEGEQEKGLNGK